MSSAEAALPYGSVAVMQQVKIKGIAAKHSVKEMADSTITKLFKDEVDVRFHNAVGNDLNRFVGFSAGIFEAGFKSHFQSLGRFYKMRVWLWKFMPLTVFNESQNP